MARQDTIFPTTPPALRADARSHKSSKRSSAWRCSFPTTVHIQVCTTTLDRITSHRIASHRITSHRIASHECTEARCYIVARRWQGKITSSQRRLLLFAPTLDHTSQVSARPHGVARSQRRSTYRCAQRPSIASHHITSHRIAWGVSSLLYRRS